MTPHGPWNVLRSHEVYRDPWLTLRKDDVIRPDGQPGTYVVATIKPGVCVLAADDEGVAHLTEEFHYGVGRMTLECVSGGIEPGGEPLPTARRDRQEERGIVAERWTELGVVAPITSNIDSPVRLFLARGLTFGEPDREGTETMRRRAMPLGEALRSALASEITHAPSCVLILKAAWLLGISPALAEPAPRSSSGG